MDQIRAFVGHSFSSADEEVVRSFLEFFNHVAALEIGFSWDHAEKAEPHDLREKVLTKIEDKNVFIGICTLNEIASAHTNLKSCWFSRSKKIIESSDVSYKSSDWIIQEIGLAIGRKMELVLLVEKGLRQPGGLQGNIERIEFVRDRPEESFNKILEMIHSLRPKVKPVQAIESSIASEEARAEQKESHVDFLSPRSDWDQTEYNRALRISILVKDDKSETRIYDSYMESEFAKDPEKVALWQGEREYLHIRFGTGGDFQTIEKLCSQFPKLGQLEFYRGRAYAIYMEPLRAAESFDLAASLTDDKAKKIQYLGYAAASFKNAGEEKEQGRVLALIREQPYKNVEVEVAALEAMLSAIENENRHDVVIGCYEALLSMRPDDAEIRFKLAYKYSDVGNKELALFHYLAIPNEKRRGGTWNNIGVAYSNCKMPIRSVSAYKEAVDQEETLAMSNLARQYLDAGFIREADDLCNKATKIENYDRQVGTTITRIKEADEEERQNEEKIGIETQSFRVFYREFGKAATRKLRENINGRWQSKRCALDVQVDGQKVKILGRYEVIKPKLGLGLAALRFAGETEKYHAPSHTQYEITYDGTVFGSSASCECKVNEVGVERKPKTLLEDTVNTSSVLLVFCEDSKTIRVLEKKKNIGEVVIEEWSRIG